MIKHICDLCGKEIPVHEIGIRALYYEGERRALGDVRDFHEHCWKRMQEIIRSEEEVRSK